MFSIHNVLKTTIVPKKEYSLCVFITVVSALLAGLGNSDAPTVYLSLVNDLLETVNFYREKAGTGESAVGNNL